MRPRPLPLPRLCCWARPTLCRRSASSAGPAPARPDRRALPRSDRIAVPCRSNGEVSIDVFHSATPSSPILIYLPPGPVIPDCSEDQDAIIATLAATTKATIARVNYRASAAHQFPTPIHDVLLGFDWVRDNLLKDAFSRPILGRMGVCGELLGGSLATMLALTECRAAESRIAAAAVTNPIVDWVFPDDLPAVAASDLPEPLAPEETALPADEDPMALLSGLEPSPAVPDKGRKRAGASSSKAKSKLPKASWLRNADNNLIPTVSLSASRDILFANPAHYLDRFASPLHFFRSPHGMLLQPAADDVWASEQPDRPAVDQNQDQDQELDFETRMHLSHYQAYENHDREKDANFPFPTPPQTPQQYLATPVLIRCRAYARTYPPAGPKLLLPAFRIAAGTQSPLLDQASDLGKLVRRSVARQALKSRTGRTRWVDKEEKAYYEQYAEGRVEGVVEGGVGVWGEKEAEDVGRWMSSRLEME